MLNVLALNCLREIQRLTGLRPYELRDLAERVSAVEFRQGVRRWWQPSEIPDAFRQALGALGIPEPQPMWTTWGDMA